MARIKRKTRIILGVLLVCVLAVAGIVFEVKRENEQVWIDPSWQLNLPAELRLIERYEPNPPVFTETYRITIASTNDSVHSSLISDMHIGRNEETEFLSVMDETKTPKECRPNFQQKYCWKEVKKAGGCLEIAYFPDSKMLYIAEKL